MPPRLSRTCLALVTAAGLAATAGPAVAAPDVVATIPPVHSLVAGVMQGVGEPALLVPGGASPHTYALRPSDAKRLAEAEVVFWIGHSLETFLEKPLESLAGRARTVALLEAEGVHALPFRETGPWEGHEHGHEDHDEHEDHEAGEHHEEHEGADPHTWLDPRTAADMVVAIMATLSAVDPAHAETYRRNGAALGRRLAALDRELDVALTPVRAIPFVVFHDAYQYMERAYGLRAVGSVSVSPERAPGARRLGELKDKIRSLSAACVFREPQFAPKLAETVIEGTGARIAVLDPLGAGLAPGPDLYFALMRRNAEALVACLGGG